MALFYWLHPQSCLVIKAPLFGVKALSFGGVLYSVSFVQSKENYSGLIPMFEFYQATLMALYKIALVDF